MERVNFLDVSDDDGVIKWTFKDGTVYELKLEEKSVSLSDKSLFGFYKFPSIEADEGRTLGGFLLARWMDHLAN